MARPTIFVSYSHADEKQKARLLTHMGALQGVVEFEVWTDSQIQPGDAWLPAIEQALSSARIAILLLTADFLASEFVRRKELPTILGRKAKDGLRVYPILAKDCAWKAIPWIADMQLRPLGTKPVWRNGGRYANYELALIVMELLAIIQIGIPVHAADGAVARRKAEQERQELETAVAAIIAESPAVETFYKPAKFKPPTGGDTITIDQHTFTEDEQKARGIYTGIIADSAKQREFRRKTLLDLQNKVFVKLDSKLTRSKTANDAFRNMDKYIQEL
jgi:hypothetical protein